MILSEAFLQANAANVRESREGYAYVLGEGLIGGDYEAAIAYCNADNHAEWANWLTVLKATEAYVRANGVTIVTDHYKIYDPATGIYQNCIDLADAKTKIIAQANAHLQQHNYSVVATISNEQGDEAWTNVAFDDLVVIATSASTAAL